VYLSNVRRERLRGGLKKKGTGVKEGGRKISFPNLGGGGQRRSPNGKRDSAYWKGRLQQLGRGRERLHLAELKKVLTGL